MPAYNSATGLEIVEQKHSKKSTLHTGHICLLGLVSSHWVECFTQCEYNCVNVDGSRNSTNVEVFSTWCKQGQQKRCPHMDTTASLAVSRHMLHCRDIKIDEARKDWIHIWHDPIAIEDYLKSSVPLIITLLFLLLLFPWSGLVCCRLWWTNVCLGHPVSLKSSIALGHTFLPPIHVSWWNWWNLLIISLQGLSVYSCIFWYQSL